MADNYLSNLFLADASKIQGSSALNSPAGIGSKAALGMFGTSSQRRSLVTELLFGEQSSARLASIASRTLKYSGSIIHEEIKALAGSGLAQAPNHIK